MVKKIAILFLLLLGETGLMAQTTGSPTATVPNEVYLCGIYPQTIALPDLVLEEVDVDDFQPGSTSFLMSINAADVSWDLSSLEIQYDGPSQSFASDTTTNGAELEITIDLASNASLETLTLSGLQLIFNAWDFSNNSPSFD